MKGFEILTLKLKNITPTIIGGYKATTFSPSLNIAERFRVPELKGIWRWWFRALVAGALWDARGDVNEDEVREKVRVVLGSTNAPSKFVLQAYPRKEGGCKLLEEKAAIPPRLKLLMLSKEKPREVYYYEAGDLEYELKLLRQPRMDLKKDELMAGVGSLLMALIFQGVGAITRRGFGAWGIQLNEESIGEGYREELREYIDIIKELNKVEEEEDAEKLIKRFIQLVNGCFSDLTKVRREDKKTN